jgi:hypothetical protein
MKIPRTLLESFFDSNFDIRKGSTNDEIIFRSPFSNKSSHLIYMNLEKGVFQDFHGDIPSGSVIYFIAEYLDIPRTQVLSHLLENYSLGEEKKFIPAQETESEDLKGVLESVLWLKDKLGIFGNASMKYLKKRKIPQTYLDEWGYFISGRYERRIFIPFYEEGKLVYFLARSIDKNEKLRYYNPKGINSKDYLFNYDRIEEGKPLVICEGVFDAASVSNFSSTAILSADISVKQVKKIISKNISEIIIVPDNDETGGRTLGRNIDLLYKHYPSSMNLTVLIYRVPDGFKDFNEYVINTGDNFIDKEKCIEYNKRNLYLSGLKFNLR